MTKQHEDVRLVGGNLTGRYVLSNSGSGSRAFACRAQSVSATSIALAAPVSGVAGQSVAIYFPHLGMLSARITRLHDFGFVAEVIATSEERVRLRDKIWWLKRQAAEEVTDQRSHPRVLPRDPQSSLVLADGSVRPCFVIDMSTSGVAVSADHLPTIGEPLAVGRVVGRVVRLLDHGFAVQFVVLQEPAQLERCLGKVMHGE